MSLVYNIMEKVSIGNLKATGKKFSPTAYGKGCAHGCNPAGRKKTAFIIRSPGLHMVETMETSDFLQGGEITFTTGLGLGTRLQLMVGYMILDII